ncbi:energy-coupling factor transporter transmembrane component T family protein [Corynebacterium sp. NPDC060344]|uniref:energy-coupling factor transporter transmembrane component T family protein n=1 Tax=Corynebacterium sp. NPDC060344 TaxID=3347101 RepID=UPI00364E554A
MNALEVAAAGSRWARRNVGDKALLCGGLLVLAISLPPWPAAALIIAAVSASAVVARVPAGLFLALWAAPAAFVAVGILPLLFSITLDGVVWSPTGPQRAAEVVARATAAIGCTMLFTVTTPLSEVLAWAGRSGIPRTLTYLAELIYRMVGTLAGTAAMMHEAQAQRLGHLTRRGLLTGVAAQSANLFVLSFQRARRLGEGLELRAEPGAADVLVRDRPRDGRFLVAAAAVLITVVVATALVRGWLP